MPIDLQYNVPFQPQQGQTEQILTALQLGNMIRQQRGQLALESQAQPSLIGQREAESRRLDAQTAVDQMNLNLRRELMGTMLGATPGSAPAQPAPPPAPGAPAPATPSGPVIGGTAPVTAAQANIGPGQTPLRPQDFSTPGEYFQALMAQKVATPAPPKPQGGLIGQTVSDMLLTPDLTPAEKIAIAHSGTAATVNLLSGSNTPMDSIINTYNGIMREHGDMARSIKTDIVPDSQSSSGYSQVATRADGTEAYRHPVAAPLPKNLEEASSYLGSASFNYQREATPGNKAALDLANKQHDLMNNDRITEAARQAQATAQAQGKDYEAMVRNGTNPITKEKLTLNNAPAGALVNPASGQVIPTDMISLYKPTQEERQTADTARQVLAISQDLKNEIAKNPKLIGPLAGREQQALQGFGYSSRDAAKLIDDVTFLQSASTKMHTGRFSGQILDKMGNIIKPGMNKDEFLGSLDSVNDVATRYSHEDSLTTVYEYQQRQQFENQAASSGNPFVPGQFSPGNPFAPKR